MCVKGLEKEKEKDVDQCTLKNGGCSPSATCTNTHGKIKCTCKPGFTGNGLTCTGKFIYLNESVVGSMYASGRNESHICVKK